MAKLIRADELTKQIISTLNQYVEDVEISSVEAAEAVAKDTVAELKQGSPKRKGKGGGKYAKNWTYRDNPHGAEIYNKAPTYRLTHLLEKGHATRNGGRVDAIVHIAPAEERAVKAYEDKIIKGLQK